MEALLSFDLFQPATLDEAVGELAAHPGALLMAGGTDLLPNLRRGVGQAATVISLGRVAGLDRLACSGGTLSIGAAVTLARLASAPAVARSWSAIAQAAQSVAAPTHRNAATLGGNLCLDTRCVFYNQSEWWRAANGYCLKRGGTVCHVAPLGERCHAAFAGDMAPALLVLQAAAALVSPRGTRSIPLAQLYTDDGAAHLTLAPDEVLACVEVPSLSAGLRSGYLKGRLRGAIDFPLAGVAICARFEAGALRELRVALTGTNSRPMVLEGCDELLGRAVDDGTLAVLGKLVSRQASPARTTATPSNHRRQVAATLAQRLLGSLALSEMEVQP